MKWIRGEEHHNAKLTETDVKYVRLLATRGRSQTAIAREVGLNQSTVSRIVARKIWGHVE